MINAVKYKNVKLIFFLLKAACAYVHAEEPHPTPLFTLNDH